MRRPMAVLLALTVSLGAAVAVPALSAASPQPRSAPSGPPTKGIAVLLDAANQISDAQAVSISNSLFSTIVTKFHANAVSLNFPYRQSSSTSNDPSRATITPSPQRLAAITAIARRYHLAVQYRPYLFEGDLLHNSRTQIKPSNPTLWLQSYWTFLEPYLISANEAGVSSFSVAQELPTLLSHLSGWTTLIQRAKSVFSGELIYSQQHQPMVSLPLTARGYDAYQPIPLSSPKKVSVSAFTSGFTHNFQLAGMQSSPADIIIEELGIAAVSGAYNEPFYEHYPVTTKVDRVVQEDWFQGACNAFWALHMKGIYFWAIGFNNWSVTENNTKGIYTWYNTPTENVVASCFARSS
jgi:glycosyl hydrolase family 113